MQRVTVALVAACVGACSTPPTDEGPSTATNPAFAAAVVNDQFTLPFELTYFDQCSGETIAFDGRIHFEIHSTSPSSGGFEAINHYNLNIRGIGDGGSRFVGNETGTTALHLVPGAVNTQQLRSKLIRVGDGVTLMLTLRVHVTVDANGRLAVQFSDSVIDPCR